MVKISYHGSKAIRVDVRNVEVIIKDDNPYCNIGGSSTFGDV